MFPFFMFYIIPLLFILINIIEAKLQSIILKDYTDFVPEDRQKQNKYHFWFGFYYIIVIMIAPLVMITTGWSALFLVPILITLRRLVFQSALNSFRKTGLLYMSNRGVDAIAVKMFGKKAGVMNIIICSLVLALCFYLHHIFA